MTYFYNEIYIIFEPLRLLRTYNITLNYTKKNFTKNILSTRGHFVYSHYDIKSLVVMTLWNFSFSRDK